MKNIIFTFIFLLNTIFLYSQSWIEVRDLVRATDKISEKKIQEEGYRKAYLIAQSVVKVSPKDSDSWLWLANSAGRLAQIVGSKEKIQLSKVVKDNAEKSILLDPNNGQAFMTLGAWHFYVADLSWLQKQGAKLLYGGLPPASYKEAVKYLLKSLEIGVDNPVEVNYILALAYKELGMIKESKIFYNKCSLGSPRNEKEKEFQNEAKEQLK